MVLIQDQANFEYWLHIKTYTHYLSPDTLSKATVIQVPVLSAIMVSIN